MLRWGEALAAAALKELVTMGAMEGRAGREVRRRRRSAERQDEQIILVVCPMLIIFFKLVEDSR